MRASIDFKAFPEAENTYNTLEPSDRVLKHEWLFRSDAVVYSRTELLNPDFDIHQYEEIIERKRTSALSEIYSEYGPSGLIRLAGLGEGQHAIGYLASQLDSFGDDEARALVLNALDGMTERKPPSNGKPDPRPLQGS